jgi:hypothetical protein
VTETNVFQLSQPGTFADPLTEVLRNGARALLTHAVEAEVAALLSCHADKLNDDGRQRLVRHGHLPERKIVTFPAEHWKHLRTSNVIESSFATIRHRTVRSKGCLSNKTALAISNSPKTGAHERLRSVLKVVQPSRLPSGMTHFDLGSR